MSKKYVSNRRTAMKIDMKFVLSKEAIEAIGFKLSIENPSKEDVVGFITASIETQIAIAEDQMMSALARLDEEVPLVKLGQGNYVMELRPSDIKHGRHEE